MKRDMSLIREILLWAIDQPHGYVEGNPVLEGWSEEEIGHHVYLMRQAGLVDAAVRDGLGMSSPEGLLISVTWQGHEFADAARDGALWKRAGSTVLRSGASFTFELLSEWLKEQLRSGLSPTL